MVKTEKPILVSIIIPCFNDFLFIEEAFNSAVNQTYGNTEIIIVDDGSNYITKQCISNLTHEKLQVFTQENQGLSAARNTGIKNSKGEYLLFLDSDDYFDSEFLDKAIPAFENDNKIGIITCYCRRFNDKGTIDIFKPPGGDINNFLFQNSAIGTSLIKRECFSSVGLYDENMKDGYEDWEFYIRATQQYTVHVLLETLHHYRQKKTSMRLTAVTEKDKAIRSYIFNKHKILYYSYYEKFVEYFLSEQERLKINEQRQREKIDFKVGNILLKPLRLIKRLFN